MFHLMKQALLVVAVAAIHFFASAQQTVTEQLSVYFDTDKSELTADSRKKLGAFLSHIDTLEGAQLTISGHTDARASNAYNDKLSQRRVGSVLDFLNTNKLSELPPITSNLAEGENRPAAGNATAKDMALNRRVELTLTYPEKTIVAEKPQTDNIADLYKRLAPKPSTYCIDNTRDTFLVCEKGTVVRIPAFCFSREKKQSCTTISVLEALSMSDMLLQNLSTESNGRLLETGGMVDIHAFDPKGSELDLLDNKALTLFFPTDSAANDFATFYGERDTTIHQTVNWSFPDQSLITGLPVSFWYSGGGQNAPSCEKCRFFFCRIQRAPEAVAGMFNADRRKANKDFRYCQKRLRKSPGFRLGWEQPNGPAANVYTSWGYSVGYNDTNAFRALYKDYMEKNGVTTFDQAIRLMQKQADSIGKVRQEMQAKSYNAIQTLQMGMINCDRFTGGGQQLAEVKSNVGALANIDGKLIFTDIRSIMPAYQSTDLTYGFPNIPVGSTNWMFFLKLEGKQAYLSLEKVTAGQKEPFEVNFRKVSDAEIAQALKVLDH